MKKTTAALMFSAAAAAVIFLQGCSRPPAASSVEFRGRVYYGVINSSAALVVIGPLPSARVLLMGDNSSVLSDENGRYTLRADVPRSFTGNNIEQYTLEAVAPESWRGTSERQGATGRPGDVIYVRDFVLHAHYSQAQ